ncbi:hypothetical protein F5144DRAFT_596597 [Chaetomium tenue]|uniref:Uncharacterized protein n=1 Tax=Chaetomium tenue TaxID=1854479 RepID=A0ACB7NXV3_9PEZI|nr:hypothetical protein F5144DRAFT_596597 [Chaetomium globosum]
MSNRISQNLALALCLQLAGLTQGHVVITYPGWRGNNLGRTDEFPFGMQWMYPCGGLPVTTNRTHWPIGGGAVAFQPGWFTGHASALIYINIGLGEQPENYSQPIVKFHLQGPTDNPYPGSVCLPQLTLPDDVRKQVKSGDLATIQVIEAAKHGAGLFTCPNFPFLVSGVRQQTPQRVPLYEHPNASYSSTMCVSCELLGACRCHNYSTFSDNHNPLRVVSPRFSQVYTMKVIPSPILATKATPHARHGQGSASSPRVPSILARHPIQVDFVRPQRPAIVPGNNRAAQHIRRNSGSKYSISDAKVNKPASHLHRTRVGLWLENIEASHGLPSPTLDHQSPYSPSRRRSMSLGTASPHGTKFTRNANAPRVPLADITSLVLAADCPTTFYASEAADAHSQSSTSLASDLSGAVDMLTTDEAKRLLLMSAQSNMSLAEAIRGIAISRSQTESSQSTQQVEPDYLADTFVFDEHLY